MPDPKKILRVDSVVVVRNKKMPPEMETSADGMCSTTGWSNAQLSRYEYVTPPADGIQEFDFVAIPPSGIVHQTLTRTSATDVMGPIPEWCKGVRVYSATNDMDAKL